MAKKIRIETGIKIGLLLALLVAAVGFLIYGKTPPFVYGWWGWVQMLLKRFSDPEGLRFTITATGVISFSLTYINSVRVHRVKGILVSKAIRTFYPWYGIIFILHGCFVILGIYSCAVRVRPAGSLCALGILTCLIYAIKLARLALSDTYEAQLIQQYIEQLKIGGTAEEKCESIYAIAQYINQQVSSIDRLLDFSFGSTSVEADMDHMLDLLETVIPQSAKAQSEFGVLSDFEQLFAPEGSPANPKYVLFSIPAVKTQKANFQQAVVMCGSLWRNLLDGLKWQTQAKLAYQMLCRAESNMDGNIRRPSAAALCCGLVFYLYTPAFLNSERAGDVQETGAGGDRQGNQQHYAYIIQQINRFSKRPADQVAAKQQYLLRTVCKDMAIIGLCLLALEQTTTTEPVDYEAMLSAIYNTMWGRSEVWEDRKLIDQYLCFAQIIASLNHFSCDRISMLKTAPLIFQAVKSWLSAGPKKYRKVDAK